MRTRTLLSASIAAWAIALPLAAAAPVGADPQQEETVEPQKPPMAEPEESVELQRPPEAKVVTAIPPVVIPPVILSPLGTTTTIFAVRHAEDYAPCPPDHPPWEEGRCLSAEGTARAQRLLQLLQVLEPSKEIAVYSTKTNRTWQTAQPTAEFFGVEISPYRDRDLEGKDLKVLADTILQEHLGRKVLVVSHSGRVSKIAKHLGAPEGSCKITSDVYDNLCIVTRSGLEFAGFVHLHYGGPSPMPDLVIAALQRHPSQPRAGATLTFTATVRNVGSAASGACKLSLKASWKDEAQICNVPALEPGQSVPVTCSVGGAVVGTQSVTATVDSGGTQRESDESNNERRSSFTVLPRDDDQLPPGVKCRTASDCGPVQLWNCCEPGTRASRCVRKPGRCP